MSVATGSSIDRHTLPPLPQVEEPQPREVICALSGERKVCSGWTQTDERGVCLADCLAEQGG